MELNLNELNGLWRARLAEREEHRVRELEELGCVFQWVDHSEVLSGAAIYVHTEGETSVLAAHQASFRVSRDGRVLFIAPLESSVEATVRRVLDEATARLPAP